METEDTLGQARDTHTVHCTVWAATRQIEAALLTEPKFSVQTWKFETEIKDLISKGFDWNLSVIVC